jgi:DNA-directed RNA polymerase specialized sigma subunit
LSAEQLGPEFVVEHAERVERVALRYAKEIKAPLEDIRQSVWEGLIRAHRKHVPQGNSLWTWARVFILQALQRTEPDLIVVPTSTEHLYRKVMAAADGDVYRAAELCRSRKWGISERTLVQVFVAQQPWVSFDQPIGTDENGEILRIADTL